MPPDTLIWFARQNHGIVPPDMNYIKAAGTIVGPRQKPPVSRMLLAVTTCVALLGGCRLDGTLRPPGTAIEPNSQATQGAELPPEYRIQWTTDFDAAQHQALTHNRLLLVVFTGSDWCVWCQRLHDEILTSREFQEWVGDRMICVELDFPRKSRLPVWVEQRNQEVLEEFAPYVASYPTVLVLDTTGAVVARLGYSAGGAANWVSKAEHVLQTGLKHGPSVFSNIGRRATLP